MNCEGLPSHSELQAALAAAVGSPPSGNGGFNLHMWATIVDRDGIVCAVAFTGNDMTDGLLSYEMSGYDNTRLCGRATWKKGILVYAKKGIAALEKWLSDKGGVVAAGLVGYFGGCCLGMGSEMALVAPVAALMMGVNGQGPPRGHRAETFSPGALRRLREYSDAYGTSLAARAQSVAMWKKELEVGAGDVTEAWRAIHGQRRRGLKWLAMVGSALFGAAIQGFTGAVPPSVELYAVLAVLGLCTFLWSFKGPGPFQMS